MATKRGRKGSISATHEAVEAAERRRDAETQATFDRLIREAREAGDRPRVETLERQAIAYGYSRSRRANPPASWLTVAPDPAGGAISADAEGTFPAWRSAALTKIHAAFYGVNEMGGDPALAARIWAASDGYGAPGTVPPQGYDWSGIRDSSDAAVREMLRVAEGRR
jgi:hypothetical protein